MKTREEMERASAGEILKETVGLLNAALRNYPGWNTTAHSGAEINISDLLEELSRRIAHLEAGPSQRQVKGKKIREEITVNTTLKLDRMNLSMTSEAKKVWNDFLADKRTPYVYNSAALELFARMYKENKLDMFLKA